MHYKLTLGVDFALKVSVYLTSAPAFLSLCFHFPCVCVCAHTHTHPQCLLAHTTHELTPACMYMKARVEEEYVGKDGEKREKPTQSVRLFVCVCARMCACVWCVCVCNRCCTGQTVWSVCS